MFESVLLNALFIFIIRVISISIATLRIMLMGRAKKLIVVIIAFVEGLSFIVTFSMVAQDFSNLPNVIAYSGGFAIGTLVGMLIEERMGMGYRTVTIISQGHSLPIIEMVREAGFGATRTPGEGTKGSVGFIWVVVRRKDVDHVMKIVQKIDPKAFITVSSTQNVYRGFLGFRT